MRYISVDFPVTAVTSVIRGHNKKFIVNLDKETMQPEENGESYYFKYDSEKEINGNMQKRYASGFYSYLANICGANVVEDIPGQAIVYTKSKGLSKDILKGIYSKSYKNDYHIYVTFTLDDVLRPRENESFKYDNESRVFSSVENSMRRLKSFIKMQINNASKGNVLYEPICQLEDLENDYKKIQDDLVSIVMLDYLFLNNDRHTENIELGIVFDDNHKFHLVVSPIFDNDRSFGLDKNESKIIHDCESEFARESYVDYMSDVKYVIRDIDCDPKFSKDMNFSNNYHSKVIADYIKQESIVNGKFNYDIYRNSKLYKLYENLRKRNVRQDFFDYLCQLGGFECFAVKELSSADIKRFLDIYNVKTNSSITENHIIELEQNFNFRMNLLDKSMQNTQLELPKDSFDEDFIGNYDFVK